ncbi:MAG: APC family permease [Planctomycetota bacterium]
MPVEPRPLALPEQPFNPDNLPDEAPSGWQRLRHVLIGRPRSLADRRLFHRLSLIPFLAWVGLGADGLSSSAYGPEESFRVLGGHAYMAFGLAALTALTVLIISAAYTRIIEEFPHGGGGYVVATKLLGPKVGIVSGCALLVDYVLTITVSVAAAGEALFSFVPPQFHGWMLPFQLFLIVWLMLLNLRGVRESILALTPIFIAFLLTHAVLIGAGIILHLPEFPATVAGARQDFQTDLSSLGLWGMALIFLHAYSMGGGTYTGIEAVSNNLNMMREPVVRSARRTMLYMAFSLAITAAGLLVCYLLWRVEPVEGKTLNAVLIEQVAGELHLGRFFVIVTLLAEGALLVVAAQAGFMGGPRVLVNMAVDSWMPHRFSALSERLTAQNGIVLMSLASVAALLYTKGDVTALVVMYSINVFLTFTLSMFGMSRAKLRERGSRRSWRRRWLLFTVGFLLCGTILLVTTVEKFLVGGWVTLLVTGTLVAFCFMIRAHYRTVEAQMARLHEDLAALPAPPGTATVGDPDRRYPVAGLLVSSWGGLGVHTMLNIFRTFPGHFRGIVFISVGVVDSGGFKGEEELQALDEDTRRMLDRYVELARRLGMPATSRMAVGTDVVATGEQLCLEVAREFPRTTFFGGKIIFQRERWYQRLLHNETPYALQKRLQWAGLTMVVLPARVR